MRRHVAIAALIILFILPLSPCQAKEPEFLVTKYSTATRSYSRTATSSVTWGSMHPNAKKGRRRRFLRQGSFPAEQEPRAVEEGSSRVRRGEERWGGEALAYVFVKDLFVNGELIRLGYAHGAVTPPNVKYKDLFLKYEKEAKEKCAGLWQERKAESEPYYVGNKRTYVFHRPSCPGREDPRKKPDRFQKQDRPYTNRLRALHEM